MIEFKPIQKLLNLSGMSSLSDESNYQTFCRAKTGNDIKKDAVQSIAKPQELVLPSMLPPPDVTETKFGNEDNLKKDAAAALNESAESLPSPSDLLPTTIQKLSELYISMPPPDVTETKKEAEEEEKNKVDYDRLPSLSKEESFIETSKSGAAAAVADNENYVYAAGTADIPCKVICDDEKFPKYYGDAQGYVNSIDTVNAEPVCDDTCISSSVTTDEDCTYGRIITSYNNDGTKFNATTISDVFGLPLLQFENGSLTSDSLPSPSQILPTTTTCSSSQLQHQTKPQQKPPYRPGHYLQSQSFQQSMISNPSHDSTQQLLLPPRDEYMSTYYRATGQPGVSDLRRIGIILPPTQREVKHDYKYSDNDDW